MEWSVISTIFTGSINSCIRVDSKCLFNSWRSLIGTSLICNKIFWYLTSVHNNLEAWIGSKKWIFIEVNVLVSIIAMKISIILILASVDIGTVNRANNDLKVELFIKEGITACWSIEWLHRIKNYIWEFHSKWTNYFQDETIVLYYKSYIETSTQYHSIDIGFWHI